MGKDKRTPRERREQRKKLFEVIQQAGIENFEDVQEFQGDGRHCPGERSGR